MTLRIDAGDLALALKSGSVTSDLDLQTGALIPDVDGGFGPGDPEHEKLDAAREDDGTEGVLISTQPCALRH